MADAGVLPSIQLPNLQAPRGPAEHTTSAEAGQTPAAAVRTANGRAPNRGRRGPGRGQPQAAVDSAAAAAERALTDLRLPSAAASSSHAHERKAGRPPRPGPRLQASAAPFVPEVPDTSGQPRGWAEGQPHGGSRPRPQRREARRHHGSDAPPGAEALFDAQASAARALGSAGGQQQRRRRPRPGRGGGGGAGARSGPRQAGEPAPADGSDEATQTSEDGGDDHSCPICTDPLKVQQDESCSCPCFLARPPDCLHCGAIVC